MVRRFFIMVARVSRWRRVKVRDKAHALRQILDNNSNVLVMGHTLADIDAFGSALGIYVIAKKLGKEAHIVLERLQAVYDLL